MCRQHVSGGLVRYHTRQRRTSLGTWMRFSIQDNTLALFQDALHIKALTGFSFWDCSILAAARAQNCSELMTEDLTHGREVAGVRIVNPFL